MCYFLFFSIDTEYIDSNLDIFSDCMQKTPNKIV